jgi:5-methyltetrahydrofolate--homocysteine methyltransferase
MQDILEKIYSGVLEGDLQAVKENVRSGLDAGINPEEILNDALIPAMDQVGQFFEAGDYFVPEMLVAARSMQGGMEILKPLLVAADIKPLGKIVAGTVKGDLHDIGKNLVCMMLEGAGFEIIDLGVDVSAEEFVKSVMENNANIVALSALLTTTMQNMKSIIELFEETGFRSNVNIMVGGAPLTHAYAESIRADGFAPDASRAVSLAKSMVGK